MVNHHHHHSHQLHGNRERDSLDDDGSLPSPSSAAAGSIDSIIDSQSTDRPHLTSTPSQPAQSRYSPTSFSQHLPPSAEDTQSPHSISAPTFSRETSDSTTASANTTSSTSSSPSRPVLYHSPSYTTPATTTVEKTQYFNTMSAQPEAAASGSGSRSRSSSASGSPVGGARLDLPPRPSLTQTESTRPLVAPETPMSPMSSSPVDPFSAISVESSAAHIDQHDARSLAPSSVSAQSGASPTSAMPHIRINDHPSSPPVEDASEVPSALPIFNPPTYGASGSFSSPGRGGSFSSPFSNPLRLRSSAGSLGPVSPRGAAARSSATDFQVAASPTAVNRRLSSFDSAAAPPPPANTTTTSSTLGAITEGAAATKASIAARRAMRAKQAQSVDSKGNRNSHMQKAHTASLNRKPFQSTRLKGEIYKPWLEQKDPALRWARWITIASIVLGFAVAAVICWDGYAAVPSLGKTCIVLNDDFSSGSINSDIWQHEVRLDGYGYGSFQWTTDSANNSYVQDGTLYIVPTLTSDHLGTDAITNGYTLNLTADGTCTSTNVSQCVAVSNSSQLTVINPVQSARLITKETVNIKYGKVEVKAKFPSGDWLWPRISMLPANNTYGVWPRSGQIDILQGRGNNASYAQRGVDYAQSDLHWGPTTDLDRLYLTWGYREQRRTYYSQKYHTFGLEWNEDFLWTYIDSRVAQVISLRFNKESFWTRGVFPSTYTNTTSGDVVKLTNPWISSENNVAPFDQQFYLAIDLAIGSTDGWFPDGEGGKPWLDDSVSAMSDFWAAKSKWWDSSWSSDATKRAFAIDSVKVWKTC